MKRICLYYRFISWNMVYLPRLIDSELKDDLEIFGAIVIEGPKWVGKTTTASKVSNSTVRMYESTEGKDNTDLARLKPSLILEGKVPRLIDEWQEVPELWDAVRVAVDDRQAPGQFILTGSVAVDRARIKHSGAGRIYRLRMGTMSLFESGDSSGVVSIKELFSGTQIDGFASEKSIEDMARLIVRGGWPGAIGKSDNAAMKIVGGYCDTIVDSEISIGSRRFRDRSKVHAVMRSLSRFVAAPLSKASIIQDVSSQCDISEKTLEAYLEALRNLYVLETLEAWSPNLRSKTAIRVADTVHFCDPAIAAHFMSASPADLLRDVNTFGLLFESLVIRDLRAYIQFLDGDLFHYRDKNGLEADAVIHLHNGRWAAIEVKLGDSWIDDAAANLLKLRDKVNTDAMGEPAFLAVITATRYAYTRPDGVHVIPITLLGP